MPKRLIYTVWQTLSIFSASLVMSVRLDRAEKSKIQSARDILIVREF